MKLVGIVVVEDKTCSFAGCRIEFGYGVGQTARRSNNRYRSIALAVHLVQPARLVLRGHQEDVGAGFGQMSQSIFECKPDASLSRMSIDNGAQVLLSLFVPGSQEHEEKILGEQ